jgi:hypothetical protein
VLHLGNAVLTDSDGGCKGSLGVTSVFAQLAETVLRNLAIHLVLDCVDAGTVARAATSKIVKCCHRFLSFLAFGLAASAALADLNSASWCSVNRRSAMGTFVAYHFRQFPALSPATSKMARDWMSKAKSIRMWDPPFVARGRRLSIHDSMRVRSTSHRRTTELYQSKMISASSDHLRRAAALPEAVDGWIGRIHEQATAFKRCSDEAVNLGTNLGPHALRAPE